MVAGIFHAGSGIGNQLHRYIATRVLALDKGYHFSMIAPDNFKGKSFMNLDMGNQKESIQYFTEAGSGRVRPNLSVNPIWEEKTNYYNPEINFIGDNTTIDGEFQDERYFEHHYKEIDEWLNVELIDVPDDVCIINFRGGEYLCDSNLFLTPEYWQQAIKKMLEINPDFKFEVHTDDPQTAAQFFPSFKIRHDISINWRSLRFARYAIVSNSSFAILPRLLRHHDEYDIELKKVVTIAPRYWARHNTKEWSMPQNYYKSFKYI